jgi:hypothetical protein
MCLNIHIFNEQNFSVENDDDSGYSELGDDDNGRF